MTMRLDALAAHLQAPLVGAGGETAASAEEAATQIADVEHDSRRVRPGALFACIPGELADGHKFAPAAAEAGARALLVERRLAVRLPQLLVSRVRPAVGLAAAAVHDHPSRKLDLIGITGTDGKTTTIRMVAELLRSAGRYTEEIGTLTGARTTPESTDLQRTLAEAASRGVAAIAMEVSSHGLAQHRLDGCRFRVAAFTNLSREHLDYHGSMEGYFNAKARLFSTDLSERSVINVTSDWGSRLVELATSQLPVIAVDAHSSQLVSANARSSVFRWRGQTVALPMGGAFNRQNAVLAAEVAIALGLSPESVAGALSRLTQPPGRFEVVDAGQDFTVLVDYAHAPGALAALLQSVRGVTEDRVIVVFGAGGERDVGKRPQMGANAERFADVVIVTSDNPRSEPPAEIIDDIVAGMDKSPHMTEVDRRVAMRHAFAMARPGDTVVVAGKGHEGTQTVGDRELPFDDRVVATEELRLLASRSPGSVIGS